MFVRGVIQIDRPFETVAPRFLRDPSWLAPLLPSGPGRGPGRCERGTARRRADSLVVPMRWLMDDTGPFPSLVGDMAIVPADAVSTNLTFEATYTLDRQGDEASLEAERVVQVAVRAFLERLAASVQTDGGPATVPFQG